MIALNFGRIQDSPLQMKNILEKIVEYKKEELSSLKRAMSLKDVQLKAKDTAPAISFLKNFSNKGINIIAEVKKASPSKGVIRENFNPYDCARIYEDHGAACLSVLTDEHFFQGSLAYLTGIKKIVKIPCLRKDFTISEYHIYEARAAGADAILLIAAILDDAQLKDFQCLASEELGMNVLVEVHDEEELKRALAINPKLIGVNNRNLKTFDVDIQTSLTLVEQIPSHITCVSESGLETHDDLVKLKEAGFDGFLIGEAMMKEKDMGKKLKEFISGPSLRGA